MSRAFCVGQYLLQAATRAVSLTFKKVCQIPRARNSDSGKLDCRVTSFYQLICKICSTMRHARALSVELWLIFMRLSMMTAIEFCGVHIFESSRHMDIVFMLSLNSLRNSPG